MAEEGSALKTFSAFLSRQWGLLCAPQNSQLFPCSFGYCSLTRPQPVETRDSFSCCVEVVFLQMSGGHVISLHLPFLDRLYHIPLLRACDMSVSSVVYLVRCEGVRT